MLVYYTIIICATPRGGCSYFWILKPPPRGRTSTPTSYYTHDVAQLYEFGVKPPSSAATVKLIATTSPLARVTVIFDTLLLLLMVEPVSVMRFPDTDFVLHVFRVSALLADTFVYTSTLEISSELSDSDITRLYAPAVTDDAEPT